MRAGPSRTSGLDRMIANVETGHFERALSALTAAGALVTAASPARSCDDTGSSNQLTPCSARRWPTLIAWPAW